jgi:CheY-like chemotaxis protein
VSSSQLFWSRHGNVACDDHRPDHSSRTWFNDGWAQLPKDNPRSIRYQCEHCLDGPIRHEHRTGPVGRRPLVLIVEPHDARRARRARKLRQQGFAVVDVPDEVAAFSAARAAPPNLMVIGPSARTIPAGELCARLKAHPLLVSVPTVLVGATLDDVSAIAEACLLEETSDQLGQMLVALLSVANRLG